MKTPPPGMALNTHADQKNPALFTPSGLFNACGAQKGKTSRAAYSLHRLTHERPATNSPSVAPTERWCSDSGKVRANVTGNSARTVGLHPAWHLVCIAQKRQADGEVDTSHPAEPMGVQ